MGTRHGRPAASNASTLLRYGVLSKACAQAHEGLHGRRHDRSFIDHLAPLRL